MGSFCLPSLSFHHLPIEKGEEKNTIKIFYPSANVSAGLPAIFTTVCCFFGKKRENCF